MVHPTQLTWTQSLLSIRNIQHAHFGADRESSHSDGAAWYKPGVELSMNESTSALYRWTGSFVEKKRRDRRSVCRRHLPSIATWRAAACVSSCGSNMQPSTLKVVPKCKVRWSMWNDSLLGSKDARLACLHKCNSQLNRTAEHDVVTAQPERRFTKLSPVD